MDLVTISNGILEVKISPLGAEVVSIKDSFGNEKIWCGDEKFWHSHAPVLFPICGGFKDDTYILDGKTYTQKKHGFARKKLFSVYAAKKNSAEFLLKADEDSKIGFPFEFELYVKYMLNGKSLRVVYKVKNLDADKTMYFSIGSHEGYALNDKFENYSIVFEKEENLNACVLDGNVLTHDTICIGKNTKELPLKYDYFAVDALVFKDIVSRKVWLAHNGKKELEVSFPDFPYLLLWTKPDAPYICIEPWKNYPDYFDTDMDITRKEGIIKLPPHSHYINEHIITVMD